MSYKITATDVVNVGRKYKNYQEKRKLGTTEQMWDFHWAAGNKNYTIWAILYEQLTGRNFQGQAWCAMFGTDIVALTFVQKHGVTMQQAAELTKAFFGGDMPYNCQEFVNNHSNDSRLNHTPAIGAAVIFHTGSKYGHWGTVTNVDADGKGFTSIEGNTSGGYDKVDADGGAVVEKWHSLASKTLFYHPPYEEYGTDNIQKIYNIITKGLTITSALNIRDAAGTGNKIVGTYKAGEKIYPTSKTFVNGKAWYCTDKGWISASYCTGWVYEDGGINPWYVYPGYTYSTNSWEHIDGGTYRTDGSGYIITSNWVEEDGKWYYMNLGGAKTYESWIKSITDEIWYWVDEDGVWLSDDPNYTVYEEPADGPITI